MYSGLGDTAADSPAPNDNDSASRARPKSAAVTRGSRPVASARIRRREEKRPLQEEAIDEIYGDTGEMNGDDYALLEAAEKLSLRRSTGEYRHSSDEPGGNADEAASRQDVVAATTDDDDDGKTRPTSGAAGNVKRRVSSGRRGGSKKTERQRSARSTSDKRRPKDDRKCKAADAGHAENDEEFETELYTGNDDADAEEQTMVSRLAAGSPDESRSLAADKDRAETSTASRLAGDQREVGHSAPAAGGCRKKSARKRKRSNVATTAAAASAPSSTRKTSNPDFRLASTDNKEIKTWLRQKNRILRKQRAEERQREREQKRLDRERQKEKEQRERQSSVRVAEWMQKKKTSDAKSTAPSGERNNINDVSGSCSNHSGHAAIGVGSSGGGQVGAVVDDSKRRRSRTSLSARSSTLLSRQCLSPTRINFPQQPRQSDDEAEAEVADVDDVAADHGVPRPLNGGRNSPPPTTTGRRRRTGNVEANAGRLSYDDWLRRKRLEDRETRRRRERQQEMLRQRSTEYESLVQAVARRRVEAILAARKRVDSGLQRGRQEGSDNVVVSTMTSLSSINFCRQTTTTNNDQKNQHVDAVGHIVVAGGDNDNVNGACDDDEDGPCTWNAFPSRPARHRQTTAARRRRPPTAGEATGSPIEPTVVRLHAVAPRPPSTPGRRLSASSSVTPRGQRAAWNEFGQFLWDGVNETEGGQLVESRVTTSSWKPSPTMSSSSPRATSRSGKLPSNSNRASGPDLNSGQKIPEEHDNGPATASTRVRPTTAAPLRARRPVSAIRRSSSKPTSNDDPKKHSAAEIDDEQLTEPTEAVTVENLAGKSADDDVVRPTVSVGNEENVAYDTKDDEVLSDIVVDNDDSLVPGRIGADDGDDVTDDTGSLKLPPVDKSALLVDSCPPYDGVFSDQPAAGVDVDSDDEQSGQSAGKWRAVRRRIQNGGGGGGSDGGLKPTLSWPSIPRLTLNDDEGSISEEIADDGEIVEEVAVEVEEEIDGGTGEQDGGMELMEQDDVTEEELKDAVDLDGSIDDLGVDDTVELN